LLYKTLGVRAVTARCSAATGLRFSYDAACGCVPLSGVILPLLILSIDRGVFFFTNAFGIGQRQ
jgi:hypothetical protein